MKKKFPEYKGLQLPLVANRVQERWEKERIFQEAVEGRPDAPSFVFYEGPPSANGLPGIHHVMGRTIKDIFCRYQTLKGFRVERKAGWDTHGLPVELGVEKELGITKEDIGSKISIEEYNNACKNAVMKYTDIWNNLTKKMGYWVDMEDPYVTYQSKYMESVWWLLGQLYEKDLLYKGYTIQPYSPKAGTGLSSHELNQPGCYRDVTDTTVVAQFKIAGQTPNPFSPGNHFPENAFLLAWTTTPWTLPSNTALTVGPNIEYACVETYNAYTHQPNQVILAAALVKTQFGKNFKQVESQEDMNYDNSGKNIPYRILGKVAGKELVGIRYEQLLPFALPYQDADQAFRVIPGDFVTTEDGTGIVHTAPTFGADDAKVAKEAGVPPLLVLDENNNPVPLVDLQGRFRPELGPYAGMYVKNEYYNEGEAPDKSVDVLIAIQLKEENRAFKVEKYVHSYPHCWRTDKPVLYYPLDSWFIKVTDKKDRLTALNNTINWKPESTGTGRFGKWLENANDWNLSRSRYWGIPIPIWSTEDGSERICISSIEQLKEKCAESVKAGRMNENPLKDFLPGDFSADNYNAMDLHKHFVDEIVLVSSKGEPMYREADLIDVWFDSGSMPYAQWHYPFENRDKIDQNTAFPAQFIAEGVDQTRGWFYTLHTIATLVFDRVAYENVVSNGLVLDKNGQKMSKRLGNTVDPFQTLEQYGADATRWYMITNAQPWDNLKFDLEGITEVQRKFFGTLYNTYSFFSLYANIDGFDPKSVKVAWSDRPEIDRWVLSKLNSLISDVGNAYEQYEPTRAGRLIQDFVNDQLSNWFVRLSRRRFWKSDDLQDKTSAYQTLHRCLETVAILASPIAPFYMDQLYLDLQAENSDAPSSVHVADFPSVIHEEIDLKLERQMELAQVTCSLVLALRKKENIRVRQPLQRILIPALDKQFVNHLEHVKPLILSEVNVKELELIEEDNDIIIKKIKPNFKTIGPKYGQQMKAIAARVAKMDQHEIRQIEQTKTWSEDLDGVEVTLELADFEIQAQDIPGWLVASDQSVTVALDITLNDQLLAEGVAREVVNRVQNLRKELGLDVTDRIKLTMETSDFIQQSIEENRQYIQNEVLAEAIEFGSVGNGGHLLEIVEENDTKLLLVKC